MSSLAAADRARGADPAGDHNVADLFGAIAGAVGDRECIVAGPRRLTWAEVDERTDRLAGVLAERGLGLHGEVTGGPGWASPHDHVGLYLHNAPEYLEGMLGAWKARCVGVNINHRYVAGELAHVLGDCRAAAVVYHAAFAPTLAEVLPRVSSVRLLLQVDDGSGTPLLPGALDYGEALAASTHRCAGPRSPDDRYVLYTGGTTGAPKGVVWRQGDFVATCLGVTGSHGSIVDAARRRSGLRTLPSAPFMHGAAHWNALSALLAGGTVVIPDRPRHYDPADVLATCERERVTALQVVGDPFARPLLDEMDRRRYDLSRLRHLLSGGAVLSPTVKAALAERLPQVRIVDVLGSSESGRQAIAGAASGFRPSATTHVVSADRRRRLEPGEPEVGWLAQAGRVPLGYLGDPERSAATFPVIDGSRHAVAGDRARLAADGTIEFLGRDSATINTGGEKVFAEEVEQAVGSHPAIADAVVTSRPSERWGNEVVAVVQLRTGHERPSDDELRDHCRALIAGYKLPKAFCYVDRVVRSPAGKADYRWARGIATSRPSSAAR
ncbi:MAG: acyl-CoA synthetase [Acidimicrobiia bacterium]